MEGLHKGFDIITNRVHTSNQQRHKMNYPKIVVRESDRVTYHYPLN
ncbi:hypothetical protein NIES3585_23630 [Nodularia sp. NIES-3585]|nr:hypothetical protein NIES3585_23630 [Nodularia sp. NIES-3585]